MKAERERLKSMIESYRLSQAIFVAAELRIADRLGDGAMSVEVLARASETDLASLRRLLRVLASAGLVKQADDGSFALASLGQLLRQHAEGSLHAWARLNGSLYPPWGELLRSIRTGREAFDGLHGKTRWQHLADSAADSRTFNDAMAEGSVQVSRALLASHDLSQFKTFVDVGGGNGLLMETILRAYPEASGVVFDLPEAIRDARRIESSRCHLAEGSFFDSVPQGGDAYLLSRVLHDWNDDRAQAILHNTRRAMPQGAILFVIERILDAARPSLESTLADLNMMVMNGGRERTRDEFDRLLQSARFRITRVAETGIAFQIIDAEAV